MATETKKPIRLHQLLAVTTGMQTSALKALEEAYHLAAKPSLFEGEIKQYHPLTDDGLKFDDERVLVRANAFKMLETVAQASIKDMNISFQRDRTNAIAKASVVVDGKTIIKDAPISFLLNLEDRINKFRKLAERIPTFDHAESWTYNNDVSHWTAAERSTYKTQKVLEFPIVAPATDKHPAQVREVHFAPHRKTPGLGRLLEFGFDRGSPTTDESFQLVEAHGKKRAWNRHSILHQVLQAGDFREKLLFVPDG